MSHQKIGQLLVQSGVITSVQLDTALQAQKIFGGRLGTNLIEMGLLDPDTFASFLSQQLNLPRAGKSDFETISKDILDLIPAQAAERLLLIPLRADGGLLEVAMLEPADERVIRRIEKNINMKVVPKVASEVELRKYLEKYYGIARDLRHFRALSNHQDQSDRKGSFHELLVDVSSEEALKFFFNEIKSIRMIPEITTQTGVLEKENLNPELLFIYQQIDGFSTLEDLIGASPFKKADTLRAYVKFAKNGWISFYDE